MDPTAGSSERMSTGGGSSRGGPVYRRPLQEVLGSRFLHHQAFPRQSSSRQAGGDRFIPCRSAMDFDYAHAMLTETRKEREKAAAASPSREAYRKRLAEALLQNRTRILAFKPKVLLGNNYHSESKHTTDTKKEEEEGIKPHENKKIYVVRKRCTSYVHGRTESLLSHYQRRGASSGIGKETARVLALRGVHVVMAVRNSSAGNKSKESIIKEIPTAKIDILELDLSSMASVRKFASDFNSLSLPLNILM